MKKPFVIHPLLVAVFPTLFLYAHNVRQMTPGQIIIPVAISLGLALVLWVIFGLLLRNRVKAGLATSILVFCVLTYGQFHSLISGQNWLIIKNEYLLPTLLLAFGVLVFAIHRACRDFGATTRILNIAAAALIAINAFSIVSYKVSVARMPSVHPQNAAAQPAGFNEQISSTSLHEWLNLSNSANSSSEPLACLAGDTSSNNTSEATTRKESLGKPDIYLIILDEYAEHGAMERLYGYDNTQFVSNLEALDFYVAGNSKMHNATTERAVASILNMEYTTESEPIEVTSDRLAHNKVMSYLHSQGYKNVYFGQYFDTSAFNFSPDIYVNYYETTKHGSMSAEFSSMLRNTTMLSPLQDLAADDSKAEYFRESLLKTLDSLVQVTSMEGPKFTYAHLLAPHWPYVFGPNGETVPADLNDRDAYFGQYVFTTRIIQKVIEQILAKSAYDPIIIVQSDHGLRMSGDWENVLNAYHLPGDGRKLLHDYISPVNSFRIIFNSYLGGSYELLEDR